MNLKHPIFIFLTTALLSACCHPIPEAGVPADLAAKRAAEISGTNYSLFLDLTAASGCVNAVDTIMFDMAERACVSLDFKVPAENLKGVEVNGRKVRASIENEHITIARRHLCKGHNVIAVNFIAGEQSLNRREEFLYTLLVPDRARTLFPCFDQPDLKAVFRLTLNVPEGWIAVSNTGMAQIQDFGGYSTCSFFPTEPLSTYLFSFVAGRFQKIDECRNGRTVSMYHRETEPEKIAQSGEIFKLVFDSLEWLEEYTGIPYPFSKYDFVVLPDFQYGGMEHAGATLYNDRKIFLTANPTTDELLDRASLIAHETAHMWFGDYVTMRWFDDVWTKEVFANWFAARIMRPIFPSVNHTLSDLKNYYASAYSEDRTRGCNAIQRPLGNLQDAGLIYCNIIYDKAPVVMDKLFEIVGADSFREGIQEYLTRFGYSNATWDDLVAILNTKTETDLVKWSDTWIKEAGMPSYTASVTDGQLQIIQEDTSGRGLQWQQEFKSEVADGKYWIPNTDGRGYGWFIPDEESMNHIMQHWRDYEETARMSLLMTLYENSWHETLGRKRFVEWCSSEMVYESNSLILSSMMSYAASEALRCSSACPELTEALHKMAADTSRPHEFRIMAFRRLFNARCEAGMWDELFSIWSSGTAWPGLDLSEMDLTDLSCQLMIAFPEKAEEIAKEQSSRITNPDRRETYEMLCKAASPDKAVRQDLFDSFLASPENRRPESRVLSALALLCHHSRLDEAAGYIIPSLDALPEIQRTGDIFFPASWCRVLLRNQQNSAARETVDEWLAAHPELNPLLATKILQASN